MPLVEVTASGTINRIALFSQSDPGNAVGNYFIFHNNHATISIAKLIAGHVYSPLVRLQDIHQWRFVAEADYRESHVVSWQNQCKLAHPCSSLADGLSAFGDGGGDLSDGSNLAVFCRGILRKLSVPQRKASR